MDRGEVAGERKLGGRMLVGGAPVLVNVRNRFDGHWSAGFQIVETLADHDDGPSFKLRRLSDGRVLPGLFHATEIAIE